MKINKIIGYILITTCAIYPLLTLIMKLNFLDITYIISLFNLILGCIILYVNIYNDIDETQIIINSDNISKYNIISGSLNVTIEAKNHKLAIMKAINKNNLNKLGFLIECLKDGDNEENTIYMNTIDVLKNMKFNTKE